MKRNSLVFYVLVVILVVGSVSFAQVIDRERPADWDNLVFGACFKDRFYPIQGNVLSEDTWGAESVLPRYIDNGIEDRIWSYWGGNIKKGEDDLYHLFVCGWLESSERGHLEWPNSYVFNAVSSNLNGPFYSRNIIGKGHNPEVFQLDDGRYVCYVIDGRYVTDDINGLWEYGTFDFDSRDRDIIEGLSNLSFVKREDGSFVMVCRGGGIWVSKDGLSMYNQLTDKSVYPNVEGEFEDPVIWKDHIQYHLIVNDWLGRTAYYLRSKDGVEWVVDPGEAYTPGIAIHENGYSEDWFKYERIKMYQDEYGRAIQANFAVIDTIKWEDKPFDNHSSKNICIPLNPGLLLELLDNKPITKNTKTIRLKIKAEKGFNPHTDVDIESLRFGASAEVNYGRGCKATDIEREGNDLVVVFDGKGNGISKDEFAPKLIGRCKNGKLLYGYARLPYVDYIESILSTRSPKIKDSEICIEIENFGQVASKKSSLQLSYFKEGKKIKLASRSIPSIKPYDKLEVKLSGKRLPEDIVEQDLIVTLK